MWNEKKNEKFTMINFLLEMTDWKLAINSSLEISSGKHMLIYLQKPRLANYLQFYYLRSFYEWSLTRTMSCCPMCSRPRFNGSPYNTLSQVLITYFLLFLPTPYSFIYSLITPLRIVRHVSICASHSKHFSLVIHATSVCLFCYSFLFIAIFLF